MSRPLPAQSIPLLIAGLLAAPAAAAAPAEPRHQAPNAAVIQTDAVDDFRALAERRARDYDRHQDLRPDQLLALLDVAERTGYSLGQLLATGEHESARTWNDFVRPPLSGGRVGKATGVWQFQPATFARILHLYGGELLALTEADPGAGRRRLDLGFGPFCDDHVRLLIADAAAGLRDADDDELMLLRHNFTVLAFAKYLLSSHSGARNPVEDYLFHFLGAGQGRRILALARGEARNTRTVKPKPPKPLEQQPLAGRAPPAGRRDGLPPRPELVLDALPGYYRSLIARGAAPPATQPRAISRPGAAWLGTPAWPAPHGYDYDSPVVTGNLRMFYRDGPERTDPYTWAEFLDHLARRVKAEQQPRLVRAKYGVGFALNGGDMPRWTHPPDRPGEPMTLRRDDGRPLALPKGEITAALDQRELRDYQRRLATLIALDDAAPAPTLSDLAAAGLYRLGLLRPDAEAAEAEATTPTLAETRSLLGTDMGPGWGVVLHTGNPRVRDALHAFRALIGKSEPDDPAQADLLLPAERVALEVYADRIARLTALRRQSAPAAAPDR